MAKYIHGYSVIFDVRYTIGADFIVGKTEEEKTAWLKENWKKFTLDLMNNGTISIEEAFGDLIEVEAITENYEEESDV